MNNEWIKRAEQALNEDNLHNANKLLMEAQQQEVDGDLLSKKFQILAVKFKEQGMFESAIDALDHAAALSQDPGLGIVKKQWVYRLIQRGWFMSRKNCYRTSCEAKDDLSKPLHLWQGWFHSFKKSIQCEDPSNIPSPVIAHDMIITGNNSLNGFIGLRIDDGKKSWASGIVTKRLTYASSPVYIRPWLFFATQNCIRRICINDVSKSPELLFTDDKINLTLFSAPLCWKRAVVFTFEKHVFLYNIEKDNYSLFLVQLEEEKDRLRSPVVCDDEVFIVSTRGKIYKLSMVKTDGELPSTAETSLESGSVCSALCSFKGSIYFESVNIQGVRKIHCYTPRDNTHLSKELDKERSSTVDSHLNFSPIALNNKVLFFSNTHPRVHLASRAGRIIDIIPLNIEIRTGDFRVTHVSQIFSATIDSYLLSKTHQGFFYINLEGEDEGVIEMFPSSSDLIAQPIVYGKRIFFLCTDGV